LKASPKTVLEYQVSLNAFLNWLCDMDRIPTNPLRKVREVETKGQQVRPYRAFTPEELRQLLSVAGKHRLAYLTLLYTAQRKSEVRALVWGDLHLDGQRPYILFRDETTKDKKKRAVALRRELARLLLAARPDGVDPTKKVFWAMWPTYDILMGHLRKAGIARKDGMGRVVHFHSFRKTWQTLGVRSGVNQRAAQEILGHTDANLTAQAYTDVPALGMDDEVAKLPWVGDENSLAHRGAHFSAFSRPAPSLADICSEFIKVVKVHGTEEISHALASAVTPPHFDQLAARAGIEPVTK
jgi:integrase